MVSRLNDHLPVPVGSAILMTQEQVDDIRKPIEQIAARLDQPATPGMTDAQFGEIKRLLEPGFELSTLMLADYKAQRGAPLASPQPWPQRPVGWPDRPWPPVATDFLPGQDWPQRPVGWPADRAWPPVQSEWTDGPAAHPSAYPGTAALNPSVFGPGVRAPDPNPYPGHPDLRNPSNPNVVAAPPQPENAPKVYPAADWNRPKESYAYLGVHNPNSHPAHAPSTPHSIPPVPPVPPPPQTPPDFVPTEHKPPSG